jgi:hypothetical protein
MKDTRQLAPGDTVTLRIPVDAPQKYIDYLNKDHGIRRNKHILNLLFSKIEDEAFSSKDKITISLPSPLTNEQKSNLTDQISSMVKLLMTGEFEKKENNAQESTSSNENQKEISLDDIDDENFDGLMD